MEVHYQQAASDFSEKTPSTCLLFKDLGEPYGPVTVDLKMRTANVLLLQYSSFWRYTLVPL